jgi:hypothetical protein
MPGLQSRGISLLGRSLAAAVLLRLGLVAVLLTRADAATLTAQYAVRFDAAWSAASHPIQFPPNPHFSGLIGGTHNASVHFWEPGELASLGIKDMAERGLTASLGSEVQAAIDGGTAAAILLGGGISPSPGSVSLTFTIGQTFPRVTLVSMVAPSPDWFVGVNGLSLFESGNWVDSITVSLQAYDAGTDSGTNYTSANLATLPPASIALSPAPPFAAGTPLGTFTFRRVDVPSGAGDMTPGPGLGSAVGLPNPFQRNTGVRFVLPQAGNTIVTVYDVAGRTVQVLHTGHLGAGAHFLAWDGRDVRGARTGGGVYYFRVESGNRVLSAKVVRVN